MQMGKLMSSDDDGERDARLLLQVEASEKIAQEVQSMRGAAQKIQ